MYITSIIVIISSIIISMFISISCIDNVIVVCIIISMFMFISINVFNSMNRNSMLILTGDGVVLY